MVTSSLHKNRGVRFFVLCYLLLLASSGNAFFWCQDAEAASHLEANLSGSCWTPCPTDTNRQHPDQLPTDTGTTLCLATTDCLDSLALTSIITPAKQNNPKSKVAVADSETPDASYTLTPGQHSDGPAARSFTHNLPPRQALTALQTIVLLQ